MKALVFILLVACINATDAFAVSRRSVPKLTPRRSVVCEDLLDRVREFHSIEGVSRVNTQEALVQLRGFKNNTLGAGQAEPAVEKLSVASQNATPKQIQEIGREIRGIEKMLYESDGEDKEQVYAGTVFRGSQNVYDFLSRHWDMVDALQRPEGWDPGQPFKTNLANQFFGHKHQVMAAMFPIVDLMNYHAVHVPQTSAVASVTAVLSTFYTYVAFENAIRDRLGRDKSFEQDLQAMRDLALNSSPENENPWYFKSFKVELIHGLFNRIWKQGARGTDAANRELDRAHDTAQEFYETKPTLFRGRERHPALKPITVFVDQLLTFEKNGDSSVPVLTIMIRGTLDPPQFTRPKKKPQTDRTFEWNQAPALEPVPVRR